MTDKANNWYPPTPQSVLAPVPGHKQQLPPSFALPASSLPPYQQPSPDTDSPGGEKQQHRPRSESLAYLLNPETDNSRTERATPSSLTITAEAQLTGPVFGYFESLQQGFQQVEASGDLAESPEVTSLASNEDDEDQDPSYTSSGSRKRPRREAAVTASRLIPRQPSPFELSPPPSRSGSGGVASSNRKVSHSLIERRRRERINDCLGHLKQVVPQCRAEGEKKVARAKERGRKRGKKGEDDGGDDGQRGGLHKLEILQGTIRYIEELESRLATLESRPTLRSTQTTFTESTTVSPSAEASPLSLAVYSGPLHKHSTSTSAAGVSLLLSPPLTTALARSPVDEATAELLLNLSTSPELRPIHFD